MSFPLMPRISAHFAAPSLSFTASFTTSNNYTTTTWTAVAIGAAAPNRYVIVSLHTDPGTVTPTAVTIGGISATLLQANDGVGLANIRERLQLLHGNRAELVIEAPVDGGALCSIRVPFTTLEKH